MSHVNISNVSVSDGIKAAIGYQIGMMIGSCVAAVFRGIKLLIALVIMFNVGEAIKADQAKRGHSSAIIHSINK